MGAADSTCPPSGKWAAYAATGAARTDLALDDHLARCARCRGVYFEHLNTPYSMQIPHIHVVGEIGRGRFGVVYKAWSIREKSEVVALKLLHSFGDMEKHRFEREITVLSHLNSPGIVRCRESGSAGETPFFVMDFVVGTHFDEYLRRSDLDLNGKLEVLCRVCLAVADAHAAGVVHRDLKPRNILVDAEGQPHILDFGICSVNGVDWTSWADGTITLPGDVIGTLKYMSPEQAWGGGVASEVSQASDVWALGIMLHEIATDGEYPYSISSTKDKPAPEALLERIRKELPKMPRLDHLPRGRDLETLIERCLTWEPERRLSSAATLAADLERIVRDEAIRTPRHGIGYRAQRLAVGAAVRSRAPFHALAVAAVLAGISAFALVSGAGWRIPVVAGTVEDSVALPPDAGSMAAHIRVVGIGDGTAAAVVEFTREQGLAGVTGEVTSWRALHGRWMARLASARPRAVIWDYYFRTEQPGDAELAAGVEALEAAGVPVVLAARTFDERGNPDLSPGLLRRLKEPPRAGVILARDMVRRSGEFVAAVRRSDGTVLPNVTLVALAGLRYPQARLEAAYPAEERYLDLLYRVGPGVYLRARDRLELTRTVRAGAGDAAVSEGDVLGCVDFPLAGPDEWWKRTLRYEAMLRMTDEELAGAVGGKVLIVGDVRTARPGFAADRHTVRYASGVKANVPGCHLLADATAGMMAQRALRLAHPLAPGTALALVALALAGCGAAIPLASRTWMERPAGAVAAYVTTWGLVVLGMALAGRSEHVAVVHAGLGMMAAAGAFPAGLWVERTRNRHRALDRRSRTLRPFGSGTTERVAMSALRATG